MKDTPEERIRQKVLYWLKEEGGYPEGLMAVEHKLPKRRADIVVFAPSTFPSFRPLLMVECKADPCREEAFRQLIGYNIHLKAPLLALASPEGLFTVRLSNHNWEVVPYLPHFEEAINLIK